MFWIAFQHQIIIYKHTFTVSDYPFGIFKHSLYNCDHRTSTVILGKSSLCVYSSCIFPPNLVFNFPLQKPKLCMQCRCKMCIVENRKRDKSVSYSYANSCKQYSKTNIAYVFVLNILLCYRNNTFQSITVTTRNAYSYGFFGLSSSRVWLRS